MKGLIEQHLAEALSTLQADGTVPSDTQVSIRVTRTRHADHGDFSSNLAMVLAKPAGRAPRDIAQALTKALPSSDAIRKVGIADRGFINFFLADEAQASVVHGVLSQGEAFGRSQTGAGQCVEVEFRSSDSTGALPVRHARAAALKATLGNLLKAIGFEVRRESPVKEDAGQRDLLTISVSPLDQALAGGAFPTCVSQNSVASGLGLGQPGANIYLLPVQAVHLRRGDVRLDMSIDSGSILTIQAFLDEVGEDAARYCLVMRKYSQHLEVDLDLARLQSTDSPVYSVQFAYARICSVMRQLEQRQLVFDQRAGLAAVNRLGGAIETELMTLLAIYPEMIERAALAFEPHRLTGYLQDLANGLHRYYKARKVLVDDDELRHARVCLLLAVRQVLSNGLSLLGVSAPEVM